MTDGKEEVEHVESPDPYFEPLIHLPPVETKTLEEDEEEFVKLRAKLFRYDSAAEPPEWKERGTGDVKILRQKKQNTCRVLMRRDKTLKICANHYVLPHMELKPNCGSEKAWVWSTPSDFADEEEKTELLAIRFANVENAQKFKTAFQRAQEVMTVKLESEMSKASAAKVSKKEEESSESKDEDKPSSKEQEKEKDTDKLTDKLDELKLKDKGDTTSQKSSDKTCENSAQSNSADSKTEEKEKE